MYDRQLDNLRISIEWAQRDQNLEIFRMASVQLETLESFIKSLSEFDQHKAFQAIERLLPMEWPLWMEACRYNDVSVQTMSGTIH